MILMDFSYFFLLLPGFLAGFGVLFLGFQHFQLLFSVLFRLLSWGWGCCFGDFSGFSYFFLPFSGFLAEFWGAVWGISAVSATFFCSFPDFWRGLGCCFVDFYGFSYFFLLFSGFSGGFGVLFWEFLRFQLHKARLLCYQPMAIVHYDN